MARSLTERMIAAARLDPSVYEEVEHDHDATAQAALVVGIVAIASAIGASGHGSRGMMGAVIGAFIGWAVWAVMTYAVGTLLFNGTATWSELLRTTGFAQSPGIIAVLGFIPILGGLAKLAAWILVLIAGVIAIRQALDISTGKAVLTAVVAAVVMALIHLAIGAVVFGTLAIGSILF
jgi:hypothetical protein